MCLTRRCITAVITIRLIQASYIFSPETVIATVSMERPAGVMPTGDVFVTTTNTRTATWRLIITTRNTETVVNTFAS